MGLMEGISSREAPFSVVTPAWVRVTQNQPAQLVLELSSCCVHTRPGSLNPDLSGTFWLSQHSLSFTNLVGQLKLREPDEGAQEGRLFLAWARDFSKKT